ncbi:hypothetical protein CDAR_378501 [Caerostris darwini]|uniref:Uncharacterized protein n=1 Tax=Caerostris darwini TaxID=1538125 RepID=A0AAV4RWK1_9ARAC|nr:hypothetical protein CDAR_378501 [Caerostris darwini]
MKSMLAFLLFASILACTLAAYHYGYGYPATYGHYGGYYGGLGHYALGHTYGHGLDKDMDCTDTISIITTSRNRKLKVKRL